MKIKQHFKDITKPDDIDREDFAKFKKELYGSSIFFSTKTEKLLAKLKELSGKDTFDVLGGKFSGGLATTDKQLTELGELIAYKMARGKLSTKAKFDAEMKTATLDHCTPGAVTNLQKILYSMDDSLYSQKYDFIQNQALEYIRQNKLSSPGMEVHTANSLIHEASEAYQVIPPSDMFAYYRDLSRAPQEYEKKRAEFKDYIDRIFASREGVYNFVEVVANGYLGQMPDAPKDGAKFKAKTKENDKEYDSPALVDIKALTDTLNITIDSVIEYSEDYSEFKYKDNYQEVIQAAVTHKLMKEDIIDSQPLTYETEVKEVVPGSPILRKDENGKIVRGEDNKPLYDRAPDREIARTEKRFVIESPGGWFLAKEENDTLAVERKLVASSKLQGLTIRNGNFQDRLHYMLSTEEANHESFEVAVKGVSANMLYQDASSLDLETTVLLMSDQASKLQKYYTEGREDKDLLTQEEVVELIKASNGKVLQRVGNTVDEQDMAIILASYAKPETFFKFIERTEITLSEGALFTCFHNALLHKNDVLLENFLGSEDFINAKNIAGDTALTSAAFIGNSDAVKKLIERNLDIYALKENGKNALDLALERGNFEAFRVLYEQHKTNVENGVATFGDIESTWAKSAKVNGSNFSHRAVSSGNVDIVKYLIENKIFVICLDREGRSPLTIARNKKDKNMLLAIFNTVSEVYDTQEQTYKNMIGAVDDTLQRFVGPDVNLREAIIESKLDITEIKNRHKLYVVRDNKFKCHDSFVKRIQDRTDKDEISPILKQSYGIFYDDKKIWKAVECLLDSDGLKQDKLNLVTRALPNIKNYSRKKRLIACLSEEDRREIMQDPIMRKSTWSEYFFGKPKDVEVSSVRTEAVSVVNTAASGAGVKTVEKVAGRITSTKSKSKDLDNVIMDPEVIKAADSIVRLERKMRSSQVRPRTIHAHTGRRKSV